MQTTPPGGANAKHCMRNLHAHAYNMRPQLEHRAMLAAYCKAAACPPALELYPCWHWRMMTAASHALYKRGAANRQAYLMHIHAHGANSQLLMRFVSCV